MWQSKIGLQEELYLGYNEDNKLDCITDRNKAKVMTYEECKEWQLILMNRNMWSIERFEEMTYESETQEENVKENADAGNN